MQQRFMKCLIALIAFVALGATTSQARQIGVNSTYAIGTVVYQNTSLANGGYFTVGLRGKYAIYGKGSVDLQNGTRTTNLQALRIAVGNTIELVESRIGNAARGKELAAGPMGYAMALGNGGKNAGGNDHMQKWGVWAMFNYTHFDNDNRTTAFKGNMYTGAVGGDYKFTDRFLLGLALLYDYVDADTEFNDGKIENNNYTISPYAAFVINKYLYADLILGYSYTNKDTTRKELINFSGQDIKGSTSANRYFGAIFLNAHKKFQETLVALRVGYRHMHENQDGFSEDGNLVTTEKDISSITTNLGNLDARLRIGYQVTDYAMPYIQGGVDYDVTRTKIEVATGNVMPDNNRLGYTLGAGLGFKPMDNLFGDLQFNYHGRQDSLKMFRVGARLRYQF